MHPGSRGEDLQDYITVANSWKCLQIYWLHMLFELRDWCTPHIKFFATKTISTLGSIPVSMRYSRPNHSSKQKLVSLWGGVLILTQSLIGFRAKPKLVKNMDLIQQLYIIRERNKISIVLGPLSFPAIIIIIIMTMLVFISLSLCREKFLFIGPK